MTLDLSTAAGLWSAVVISGIYHGINPGMGWPLAVSAALMEGGRGALFRTLPPLAVGHLAAMLLILLPFGLMTALIAYEREIRLGASLLVIASGIFLLIYRRHPRAIARIRPTQLGLWSFAVATAHGAGLMLLPIYLGICRVMELDAGHKAAYQLMAGNLTSAILVSSVHAMAMIAAGGTIAFLVHAWLGLKFLKASWFNLDIVWALSLILVGLLSLWLSL